MDTLKHVTVCYDLNVCVPLNIHMLKANPQGDGVRDGVVDRERCHLGNRSSTHTKPASTIILDFPASRTMRNKCLPLTSLSIYAILFQQPERTKTVYKYKNNFKEIGL